MRTGAAHHGAFRHQRLCLADYSEPYLPRFLSLRRTEEQYLYPSLNMQVTRGAKDEGCEEEKPLTR